MGILTRKPLLKNVTCLAPSFYDLSVCGIFPVGIMKPFLPPLLLLLLTTPLLAGVTYTGKYVAVTDGDTISLMHAGRAVKIHLEGIDCPELGQAFGTRAKQFTSTFVFGKKVQIKEYYPDRYARMVARVLVGGEAVSLELVGAGLAWHYKRYSSDPVLARG